MIRLLAMAIAVAAFSLMTSSSAQAQGFNGGYQLGAGFNANRCGGFGVGNYTPREQPPYFAMHPPVYYSHIVKRPYGVSPFAAPAGIAPVEMSYPQVQPLSVKNPFFGKDMNVKAPAKAQSKKTNNKSAMIVNPYIENLVKN